MRSKHRNHIKKTRGHKIGKRPHVPLLKHTVSHNNEKGKEKDESQLGQHPKRQGHQDSHHEGGKQNKEEHTQVEQSRNTENSEKSVHPGLVPTLLDLSQSATADDTQADKTEIEAEELQ